jgi:molybdopterin converting factor small subunit
MTIRAQLYAQLRDCARTTYLDVELNDGTTVSDLLNEVYRQLPALREHDKTILVGAGVEFVDRNYKLKPGDEISIMPPVQGG